MATLANTRQSSEIRLLKFLFKLFTIQKVTDEESKALVPVTGDAVQDEAQFRKERVLYIESLICLIQTRLEGLDSFFDSQSMVKATTVVVK